MSFFLAFDSNFDDSSFDEFGTISDIKLASTLNSGFSGAIEIREVAASSYYLRENNVNYNFTIFIGADKSPIIFG